MVFDPLSIIGYVGTAAGLVGFLVSTIARLEKTGRDFQDAGKQLQWYNTRFATCCLLLKAWQRLWCAGWRPYSDEEYEYFWSPDYFEEMKEKFRLIKIEIDDIGLLLYSGFEPGLSKDVQEPIAENWRRWQERLEFLSASRKKFNPKPNWISKVCFTSFRGADLEERTKRLKDKVDDLKDFSMLAYWHAQTLDNTPVTEAELVRLLDRKQWIDDLSSTLTQLYRDCGLTDEIWSLVLSPPDEEGGLSSIDDQADILIEFDVFRGNQTKKDFEPVGIIPLRCSELQQRTLRELLSEAHRSAQLVIPKRWSQTIKELLVSGLSETLPQSSMDPRITRTTTALRLVNWTILLWHTPWTFDACTCRIRYVYLDLQGEKWSATITAMPSSLLGPPCHDLALANRRALLLGISLAELALGKQITVTFDSWGEAIFGIDGDQYSDRALLERVKHECCNDFKLSVRFCLSFDARMVSGGQMLRPNDIVRFKENVLDLLDKHYLRTLKEHQSKRRTTSLTS